MEPTHGELVAGYLGPHAIDGVLGDDGEGSDDDGIVAAYPQAVGTLDGTLAPVHGSVLNQQEAVGVNTQVVADAVGAAELRDGAVGWLRTLEDDVLRRVVAGDRRYRQSDNERTMNDE